MHPDDIAGLARIINNDIQRKAIRREMASGGLRMRKLTLSVSSAVTAFLAAPAVLVTPSPAYSQALEEITVTARKVTESLQEVPLAITALSGDDIERLNLQDLADISQQDTSVQFDEGFTPSDTRITIRGLSPTRGRPNAATLIDGIDVTSEAVSNAGGSTLINPRLIDVERIEIVKGPQSALYGRSAFAGAVQYITKDPSDTLTGGIFVGTNSEDAREIRGSVSIPLTDTLGVLVNGYGWDERGIYKNIATNDYVGGGDGAGGSVTFKWEPTDSLGMKWRTEYSDDSYDPAAQALLNDLNTTLDLNTVTPRASSCTAPVTVGAPGSDGSDALVGPLDDGSCVNKWWANPNNDFIAQQVPSETNQLNQFFATGTDLGQYDPNNPADVNQYNKNIVSFYQGKMPDGDDLVVALTPNYRTGMGATNPADAEDFEGTNRKVFRTALNLDWAINDTLDFISNTGYVDADVTIQTDIGKYYVDNGTADVASLEFRPDPTGTFASYADALRAQGITNLAPFAPNNVALGGDGINDAQTQFVQDDLTKTDQFSQEFRLAWQATDSVNLTGGIQYWQERVKLTDTNSSAIAGGAGCSLVSGNDFSQPNGSGFAELDAIQDKCGTTSLVIAYWMEDLYQGRLEQPSTTERETDHYSAYGSLNWNITDRFTTRLEARYVKEDNSVTGSTQTPCLNGALPQSYYLSLGLPVPADACDNIQPGVTKSKTANGGQPTGPSNVIICGQVGRCDAMGIASISGAPYYAGNNVGSPDYLQNFSGDSWWAFGYRPAPGVPTTLERQDNFWAPKATLEYAWTDDVMTYMSWSRGIKPGGFSLLTSGAFGLDANLDGNYDEIEFEPERLDVWEVGSKTTLFSGRVRLNGSVFYQDFKDKQVTVQKVTAGTTGTQVENISGSNVKGLELDATWQATENWLLSGGYTFLKTEYTDYTVTTSSSGDISRINAGNPSQNCSELAVIEGSGSDPSDTGCIMSFNGNELERAPKNAFLANVTYTNELFDTGKEWYGEWNFRYQDSRWVEAFNIVEFPAYHLSDVRFGILADSWDLQLFVTNVFDNDTVISGGSNPGIATGSFGFGFSTPPSFAQGGPGINAGPKLPSDIYANIPNPRIIGINAKFRFGE
jgi:outer membrane receptor protein involved in Fe transport